MYHSFIVVFNDTIKTWKGEKYVRKRVVIYLYRCNVSILSLWCYWETNPSSWNYAKSITTLILRQFYGPELIRSKHVIVWQLQEDDKAKLVEETGLQLKQINNWFINQRKRNWHSNSQSVTTLKSKRKARQWISFVSTEEQRLIEDYTVCAYIAKI